MDEPDYVEVGFVRRTCGPAEVPRPPEQHGQTTIMPDWVKSPRRLLHHGAEPRRSPSPLAPEVEDGDSNWNGEMRTQWNKDQLKTYALEKTSRPGVFVRLIARLYKHIETLFSSLHVVLSPDGCEFGSEFRDGHLLGAMWEYLLRTRRGAASTANPGQRRESLLPSQTRRREEVEKMEEVHDSVRGSLRCSRVTDVVHAINQYLCTVDEADTQYEGMMTPHTLHELWSVQRVLDGDIQATLQLLLAMITVSGDVVRITADDLSLEILVNKTEKGSTEPKLKWCPLFSDSWIHLFGSESIAASVPGSDQPLADANYPEPDDDYETMTTTGVIIPAATEGEVLTYMNECLSKIELRVDKISQLYDGTLLLFALCLEGGYCLRLTHFTPSILFTTCAAGQSERAGIRVYPSPYSPLTSRQCRKNMSSALDILQADGVPVDDISATDLTAANTRHRSVMELFSRILHHWRSH